MTPRPTGDRILVEKDPYTPTIEGGILIPQNAERTPRYSPTVYGKVVGLGPDVQWVRKGHRIALKAHAGDQWMIGERDLTLLRERDIIGIVES
jgi:co-chaperonin GroES (HSP10)